MEGRPETPRRARDHRSMVVGAVGAARPWHAVSRPRGRAPWPPGLGTPTFGAAAATGSSASGTNAVSPSRTFFARTASSAPSQRDTPKTATQLPSRSVATRIES
ncbi:hypothetical protein [Streptomyces sp. TP-A0356]|uniref:hypothetical protein n=1 Tax=Streptomyces sp. TP-A0356 TaxID=1359208 RepID=UPI00131AE729